MNTKILDSKGDGRYSIVIHDLRASEDDKRELAFNICVYDIKKASSGWNDWIAATAADSEEKAREAMETFYEEYYKEGGNHEE